GVFSLAAASGRLRPAGALAEPLHDAAAATGGGKTLVFGGGSAATVDTVESLKPGFTGKVVGHLPNARSDLSVVTVAGSAHVVGDRVFVLGGARRGKAIDTIFSFDPGSGRARVACRLPHPVTNAAATSVGSVAYLVGGLGAGGAPLSSVIEVRLERRHAGR